MRSATEILDGLSAIAHQATVIAVAWHIVIAVALLALANGWRPSQLTACLLTGTPLVSVAALAFAFGNLFNGWVFAVSVLALTGLAMNRDRRPVSRGSAWTGRIGVAMVAFGWLYPHFLEGRAPPICTPHQWDWFRARRWPWRSASLSLGTVWDRASGA
jgi:hypothetical protein